MITGPLQDAHFYMGDLAEWIQVDICKTCSQHTNDGCREVGGYESQL